MHRAYLKPMILSIIPLQLLLFPMTAVLPFLHQFNAAVFSSDLEEKTIINQGERFPDSQKLLPKSRVNSQFSFMPSWWDEGWQYRTKISINNSGQDEVLINFPVMIKLNSSRINYSELKSDGSDIRFIDNDGVTVLPYETEKWDIYGDSIIWVKVPQIDAFTDADYVYLYYGNPDATEAQNPTAVWNGNYQVVFHFKENAYLYPDSTANGLDGTNYGTTIADGKIGQGLSLNGIDNCILVGTQNTFTPYANDLTWETWIKTANATDQQYIAWTGGDGWTRQGWLGIFGFDWNLHLGAWYQNTGSYQSIASETEVNYNDDQWHHAVYVWRNNGPEIELYFDGVAMGQVSSQTIGLPMPQNNTWLRLTIGCQTTYYGRRHFVAGMQDEVRLSNIARSSDWIIATYLSEIDSFVSFSQVEDDHRPPSKSSFSPANGSTISTTTTIISFLTDENAFCRLSLNDESFADMSDDIICDGEGTMMQDCGLPDIGEDGEYVLYVACMDLVGNADTSETNGYLVYVLDITAPEFGSLPGIADVVNLAEGQVIRENPYVIQVKPDDFEYGSGVDQVKFYVDGMLICTGTEPDSDGVYECVWDTSLFHSEIRIIAYDKVGHMVELTRAVEVTLGLADTGQGILSLFLLGAGTVGTVVVLTKRKVGK